MSADACVFVVDDDQAVASSLRWLIESAGLKVETYASAQTFLDAYDNRGGCLVLDVRMPGVNGLELQERLAARGHSLPIIIVTGHGDVPMATRALKAGAIDFLEKPVSDQLLLERIDYAINLDRRQRRQRAELADMRARLGKLSARERAVLDLVVEGNPNKLIATKLGVTPKTIEAHRAKIMRKTAAGSVAELVRMSILLSLHERPAANGP
jgi:FixJ family two-component response regulator